jgi:hypothetical protein
VFAAPDKAKAMTEIVNTLKANKNAMKGWKAAVADDLERRVTGTQSQQTADDAFPVMQSKLENLLRNPDVSKALSVLYKDDPGAMNALKRAQTVGRDMARTNLPGSAARAGSVGRSRMWRMYEVVIKSKFGGLRGGNIVRNTRVALGMLPNVGQTVKVERLIMRMQFEPDLARHLLTKQVKQDDPVWRTRMLRLLTVGEAARPNEEAGASE